MKTQHTQGPWSLEYDQSLLMPYKRGNHIVTAGAIAPDGASKEERVANMRLIAAAPELLEALKQLKDAFIHIEGNQKGNQAKTDIIKYNDDVKDALNNARIILDKAIAN